VKKILTNNLRLKLIAFVIALGLWLYVYTEHHQRYFVTFPVKIIYTKLDYKLALEEGPKSIYVRLKGNPIAIENIDQRKL
jgi:YbbR domain-containing protein